MKTHKLLHAAIICTALLVSTSVAGQDQKKFTDAAKKKLTKNLLDPAAAQYRDTFVNKVDGKLYLCGQINVKNAFGAYAGFRRFVADEKLGSMEEFPSDEIFEAMYLLCGQGSQKSR